ncbi:MAG TPA: addiction module protein [Capsulimonadaceae bacterium]|jgi:putative addiction module component (TIGR02574 family)
MQILQEIARLPLAERIELVEQIWDSIALDAGNQPMSPAQRAELSWRIDHPSETTFSWEQVQARARASRQ